jgi:ribose/xylose/arabinose/galactoside ABC-type transport system permease subunit
MDLSVGALFALITVVSVLLQVRSGVNPYVAMAISLGLGVLVGLCQGAITSFFRVPSFIVTLAAFSYLQGLAYLVTGNEILR